MHHPDPESSETILIVGASRGLGLAMAAEFLERGWNVIGTVRGEHRTGLHDLEAAHRGRVTIETLDMTEAAQISALRNRLSGHDLDMLFVNAGIGNSEAGEIMGEVTTEEFLRVMVTNTLSPTRVVETFQPLVRPNGLIGVMTSGQGSIANNERGGRDVYRVSKAALNMAMRSFAARQSYEGRSLVLMAPGWIRTELGGPDAPFGIAESVPQIVGTLLAQRGRPGLRYLDRMGRDVPW